MVGGQWGALVGVDRADKGWGGSSLTAQGAAGLAGLEDNWAGLDSSTPVQEGLMRRPQPPPLSSPSLPAWACVYRSC